MELPKLVTDCLKSRQLSVIHIAEPSMLTLEPIPSPASLARSSPLSLFRSSSPLRPVGKASFLKTGLDDLAERLQPIRGKPLIYIESGDICKVFKEYKKRRERKFKEYSDTKQHIQDYYEQRQSALTKILEKLSN